MTEGGTATFPVTVSGAAGNPFTVDYTVDDGGNSLPGGTLTFDGTDSNLTGQISVPLPADDGSPQPDTTVTVTLGTPAWVDTSDADPAPTVAQGSAQTTVVDNDWTIGAIQTTPDNATVSERGSNTIKPGARSVHHQLSTDLSFVAVQQVFDTDACDPVAFHDRGHDFRVVQRGGAVLTGVEHIFQAEALR